MDHAIPILDRTHTALVSLGVDRHFADSMESYLDLIAVTGRGEAKLTVMHVSRGMEDWQTASLVDATRQKFGPIPIVICYELDDPRASRPPCSPCFDENVHQVTEDDETELVQRLLAA